MNDRNKEVVEDECDYENDAITIVEITSVHDDCKLVARASGGSRQIPTNTYCCCL